MRFCKNDFKDFPDNYETMPLNETFLEYLELIYFCLFSEIPISFSLIAVFLRDIRNKNYLLNKNTHSEKDVNMNDKHDKEEKEEKEYEGPLFPKDESEISSYFVQSFLNSTVPLLFTSSQSSCINLKYLEKKNLISYFYLIIYSN